MTKRTLEKQIAREMNHAVNALYIAKKKERMDLPEGNEETKTRRGDKKGYKKKN